MAPREYPDPAERYEQLHREERDEAHDADMREHYLAQLEDDCGDEPLPDDWFGEEEDY